MPWYEYSGRAAQGQTSRGRMEASSADAVAGALMERGITPVDIRRSTERSSAQKQLAVLLGSERISSVELIMFCRQMHTVTRAGIPIVRALRGLAASIRHEHFQWVLHDIATRLESGSNLATAMAHHPRVFNNLFVSMISVGESTGALDAVFRQLAYYLERDEQTRKSIKSATRYPMFVLIALAIAIAIVNVKVIPTFAQMFAGFNAELPLVTRFLIGMSNLFVNYWWGIIIGTAAAVGGFIYYLRTDAGSIWWGRTKIRLPIAGDLIERASMARYARSFSLMLAAGVPLNQALTLCARAIDNPYLASKIDGIRRGVERGESLLRTHVQSEMLSPLVLQMVAVGEESGRVEELLAEVAGFYESEVDYDLKKLSDRIEPILIVFMAVFVAVLALGIFLPLWDMYSVQQ